MPIKRIVNASPLILLTKIGRIDFLDAEIELPEGVRKGDFVLNLAKGVTELEKTLEQYVVTPQLETGEETTKYTKTTKNRTMKR